MKNTHRQSASFAFQMEWKRHYRMARIVRRETWAGRKTFVDPRGTFRVVGGLVSVNPDHWSPEMAIKALEIRS